MVIKEHHTTETKIKTSRKFGDCMNRAESEEKGRIFTKMLNEVDNYIKQGKYQEEWKSTRPLCLCSIIQLPNKTYFRYHSSTTTSIDTVLCKFVRSIPHCPYWVGSPPRSESQHHSSAAHWAKCYQQLLRKHTGGDRRQP